MRGTLCGYNTLIPKGCAEICFWVERNLYDLCDVRALGVDENQGVLRVWVPAIKRVAVLRRLVESADKPPWLRIEVNAEL
jgi:hypothetical protein